MNLLSIHGIRKNYTGKLLLDNVDFSVDEGEKIGIIGINGTGKSTLLKMIAGLEVPDAGEVIKGNRVHIRYLPQIPSFPEDVTIYEYVITMNQTHGNEWSIEGEAKTVLQRLGFENIYDKVQFLSGGQKKKVALAAALMADCEILVLDEPTNHLDSDMTEWLEEYLMNRKGALVMVTHDRYFLDRIISRIVEIHKGKLYGYEGNYSKYLELKALREDMENAAERKRQSILRNEIQWMLRGARARSTKQKAHIARYEELKDMKAPEQDSQVEISTLGKRMGRTTVELRHVSKSYGEHLLFSEFSYIFLKQDRIGFIGPNGCGKSTLMKIINGKLLPDTGEVIMGETIKIGYFSQENEYMDESLKVIDYVKETAEYIETKDGRVTASKMLERFLFDDALQYQFINRLSGGEKRRLYLLKILMEAPNVLVLDEPTNDLDIQTLSILEEFLDSFEGIVITVSHDRYFLDRIVQRIFVFEEGGIIRQFEGGYSQYLIEKEIEQRQRELQEEAVQKNKVKQQEVKKADKGSYKNTRISKVKFSYKEEKEYGEIDEKIAGLEGKIAALEKEMVQSATDFAKLNQLSAEKGELEQSLEEAMERWMYLNELAERIEQANN